MPGRPLWSHSQQGPGRAHGARGRLRHGPPAAQPERACLCFVKSSTPIASASFPRKVMNSDRALIQINVFIVDIKQRKQTQE